MRKIILLILLIGSAYVANSQIVLPPVGGTNIYRFGGGVFADSVFMFRPSSGVPTWNVSPYILAKRWAILGADTTGSTLYWYNPHTSSWISAAGGGGATLFALSGSQTAFGNVTGNLAGFDLSMTNAGTINFGATTYNFLSPPSTYSFGGYNILGVNQLTGNMQLVPGSSVTASNGLNIVGTDVRLGGTLTANTSIQTSTFGLTIQSNLSAIPLQTSAQNNVAFNANTVSGQYAAGFSATPNIADTIYTIARLSNNGTGTGTNNIGSALDFANATSTTTDVANRLISQWTDATNATKTSQFSITGFNSGTQSSLFTLGGTGALQLNKYGVGSFTAGTPAYQLAVTAAGDMIETSVAAATVIVDSVVLSFDGFHADTTFDLTRSGFKNLEIQAEEEQVGRFTQDFNDTQGVLAWQVAIKGQYKFYITYYY